MILMSKSKESTGLKIMLDLLCGIFLEYCEASTINYANFLLINKFKIKTHT